MDSNKNILIVEDDQKLGSLLLEYLQSQDYICTLVTHGNHVDTAAKKHQPALIILDLMLPGKNGLDICREIRTEYHGKILFLTASEDDMDQVACLELGADDFVKKPIQPRVLLARIRMLLRRDSTNIQEEQPANQLKFGQLVLKRLSREVVLADQEVQLTTSEFDLLWLLAQYADTVLSRDYLFEHLRDIQYDGLDRSMDTKIFSLRKKLNDTTPKARRILSIRNKGYLFVSNAWDNNS